MSVDKIKRLATTVYLNPKIARAAKVKAAMSDKSLSDMVNESLVKYMSSDAADLALSHERKNEPVRNYEDFLNDLKRDGLI